MRFIYISLLLLMAGCAIETTVSEYQLLGRDCENVRLTSFWDKESVHGCDDNGRLVAMPVIRHTSKAEAIGGAVLVGGAVAAGAVAVKSIDASAEVKIPTSGP